MIIDCIMYSGEADMLEFRLHELEGKTDHLIIVEAPYTHRGIPKTLYFDSQKSRFAQWLPKITYHITELPALEDTPDLNPWVREHLQRDATLTPLKEIASPRDRVLIADVDEIPSDEALAWDGNGAVALLMRTFHSAVDYEYPQPEFTSVISRASFIYPRGMAATRDGRYGYPRIENGGWHFTWVGSQDYRVAKVVQRTCHLEMPNEEFEDIRSGASFRAGQHHAADAKVIAVTCDDTWPRYIRDRKCPESWFRPRQPRGDYD